MGSVFSFVSSDLKQKIDVLNDLVIKNDNYQSIKSMIDYEKENKLLEKSDYTNGARTLLRLHRGLGNNLRWLEKLIFIQEFLSLKNFK